MPFVMFASKKDVQCLKILKKRVEFLHVQKNGRKWVSKGMIVQAMENELCGKRHGFVVTKRLNKSAVIRNRIKRRLRAVARDVLPQNAKNNVDYVIIGRQETKDRHYQDLCNDLKWCL